MMYLITGLTRFGVDFYETFANGFVFDSMVKALAGYQFFEA